MKLEHVAATVAIQRMYIYARDETMCGRDRIAHTLLCGHEVTYIAYDTFGERIGSTRITPEDTDPVTLVTETNF